MVTQPSWCRPGLGSPRATAVFFLIPFVREHCFLIIFTELKKKKNSAGNTHRNVPGTCAELHALWAVNTSV